MFRVVGTSKVKKGLSNIFSATKLDPSSCIDENTTGTSYYDSFLNSKDLRYMESAKNRTGHIEYMTPIKYYQECATKVFNSSVDSLQNQRKRDNSSIDYLSNAIESGRKFHLPYINYADKAQEGLHRMMVLGDYFGWDDQEFPVLVVDFVDQRSEIVNEANRELHKVVDESLEYAYDEKSLPEDLIEQIRWELDKNSLDESEYLPKLLEETSDQYIFTFEGFEKDIKYEVDKSDIRYRDPEDSLDIEDYSEVDIDNLSWDDLDIDDILDSLKTH